MSLAPGSSLLEDRRSIARFRYRTGSGCLRSPGKWDLFEAHSVGVVDEVEARELVRRALASEDLETDHLR